MKIYPMVNEDGSPFDIINATKGARSLIKIVCNAPEHPGKWVAYEIGDTVPDSSDPVEQLRNQAYALLYEKRKEVEYGGFTLNDVHWPSREKDEVRLSSAYNMLSSGAIEAIPDYVVNESTVITLTKDVAAEAALAMMTHYNRTFTTWISKKEEVSRKRAVSTIQAFIDNEIHTGW